MTVSYFRYGYRNGRELNFRVGSLQARVAGHQVGLWWNDRPLINWLF